jgi:hypothetical protein
MSLIIFMTGYGNPLTRFFQMTKTQRELRLVVNRFAPRFDSLSFKVSALRWSDF